VKQYARSSATRLTEDQVTTSLVRARHALRTTDFIAGSIKVAEEFAALGWFGHASQTEGLAQLVSELDYGCDTGPEPPNRLSSEPRCKGVRMIHRQANVSKVLLDRI
jgi:hypothetical protein